MQEEQDIIGQSSTALLLASENMETGIDNLHKWSDERRMKFSETFKARSQVTQYLLLQTAESFLGRAKDKYFIGRTRIIKEFGSEYPHFFSPRSNRFYFDQNHNLGGRAVRDLDEIARQRARALIDQMPSTYAAVKIIDAATARKMDKKKVLLQQAKELRDQLIEVAVPIRTKDHEDKTLRELMDFVQGKRDEAEAIAKKIQKIAEEGFKLEEDIAKALYEGLPGLSDAVVNVIRQHIDKADGMDGVSRRIEEQVLYGDSQAALDILRSFEKDETEVAQNLQAEFTAGLEKLKLSKKQLREAAKEARSAKKVQAKKRTTKKGVVLKTKGKSR